MVLTRPGAEVADHQGFPPFWVKGKIFCVLWEEASRLMVRMSADDRNNLCAAYGEAVSPVPGY